MRRLLALMRKEWRDALPLTVACALVAGALSVAAGEVHLLGRDAHAAAHVVVPALLLLILAGLASGLVANDVATRRIETLALMPIRSAWIWLAKVLFLALAGAGILVGVVALQVAIRLLAGTAEPAAELVRRLVEPEALRNVGLAYATAGVVLFFSTILTRASVALLAGLAVAGALGYAIEIRLLPGRLAELGPRIGGAFVLGSAVAFTVGRIHAWVRGRRALVGALLVLVLISLVVWIR
jgi:hypothetical protein